MAEASARRVLGLSCSPRRGGNTELMLDSALEGAAERGAETRKILVASMTINGCRECHACYKTGRCVQQDDMQELYPLLVSWEAVVLAAPIFSMGLAAQAKALIDRLQCCWAKKYVLKESVVDESKRENRGGLWLSAAGMKKEKVFEPAEATVRYFFAMLEIKGWERVTYSGVDEKGAIKDVSGALDTCREAGGRVATGVKV